VHGRLELVAVDLATAVEVEGPKGLVEPGLERAPFQARELPVPRRAPAVESG
jgi:hypothetical protein